MPVETRIRPEFGRRIKEIIGEDSLGAATARTSISKAYLMQMGDGKVPSPSIIKKFADGYKERGADLDELLVLGDYKEPEGDYERIEYALSSPASQLSEYSKQRILDIAKEELERSRREKEEKKEK